MTAEIEIGGTGRLRATLSRRGAKLLTVVVDTADGPVQLAVGASPDPAAPGADIWAGAICGRFANRIGGAAFELDGHRFELPANEGANLLHGGAGSFALVDWRAEPVPEGVAFRLRSEDGDMGFPGTLEVTAVYGISGSTLFLDMTAETDAPTVVNLTHHVYWNLLGAASGSVLDHRLAIPASRYTPVGAGLIPTGELLPVAGSRFDFTAARPIAGAYDHNFCLDAGRGDLHVGAVLEAPEGGRRLEVWTTEPAIQAYTGEHFGPAVASPYGALVKNAGLALEPQTYPDAPNKPDFPTAVLRSGEVYHHRIEWRFSGF